MKNFLFVPACAVVAACALTSCQKEDKSVVTLAKELTTELRTVIDHPTAEAAAPRVKVLNKRLMDAMARTCPQDTTVATDVGHHQMWVAQHFHYDYPGQLLTSGGFGTMGFGLGAAIGAKVGNPDKTVIHVTGDGSFRMNCNELATEQYYNLPIITFIYNNQTLGMVRQWQTLIYNGHYSQTTLDRGPDFVKLAEPYDLGGKRVCTVPGLEAAVKEALASGRGYVIDCAIEMDEMVRPMVPGGGRITQFLVD